jgi:SAM-dependent methyltransferase
VAETNRESILEQYADQRNLAARQSIYRFARPGTPDFFGWALQLARLDGKERVLDICCGNGSYLKALAAGGHRGAVHGLDLSAGMVAAAAAARADQGLVVGDAQALPFADQTADVALCMHALYHVPDQEAAVAEVRRVVQRGHGRALFVTNAVGHVPRRVHGRHRVGVLRLLLGRARYPSATASAMRRRPSPRSSSPSAKERRA